MWSLITLCHPTYPPEAREHIGHYEKTPEKTLRYEWSYGGYLFENEFDDVDLELRELVVACMNHDPTTRPSIAILAKEFEEYAKKAAASGPEDEEIQRLAHEIFGDPPPPVSAVPSTVTQSPTQAQKPATPPPQDPPAQSVSPRAGPDVAARPPQIPAPRPVPGAGPATTRQYRPYWSPQPAGAGPSGQVRGQPQASSSYVTVLPTGQATIQPAAPPAASSSVAPMYHIPPPPDADGDVDMDPSKSPRAGPATTATHTSPTPGRGPR